MLILQLSESYPGVVSLPEGDSDAQKRKSFRIVWAIWHVLPAHPPTHISAFTIPAEFLAQ